MKMSVLRKAIMLLFVVATMALFTACDIKIGVEAKDYVGKNYEDVEAEFVKLGFNNIKTTSIEDLTSEGPVDDGYVEGVSIDGEDNFCKEDAFPKEAKIEIKYHAIKKLKAPLSVGEIKDMNYTEICNAFSEKGFTNISVEEVYDVEPGSIQSEYTSEVSINNNSSFLSTDEFPFDANVLVRCHYPYKEYDAKIKVKFIENLLFSTYDVDFQIDDEIIGTHRHGDSWEDELKIKEGDRVLTFRNNENPEVKGEIKLNVTSNLTAKYEIYCHEDEITVTEKYVDRDIKLAEGEVKINCAESKFKKGDYKTAIEQLKKIGFKNIVANPKYNAWTEELRGSVDSVTINGSSKYRRGDVFKDDAKVVISYTMLEEDDPKVIAEKKKQEAEAKEIVDIEKYVESVDCAKVRDYLNKKGYKDTYTFDTTRNDFTNIIKNKSTNEAKDYMVTRVYSIDAQNKTIELLIDSKLNVEKRRKEEKLRADLESNLPLYEAKSAFEKYGKKMFPYGFKMRDILGVLAERPVNKTTWFLKYYCNITNQYGAKAKDVECEAKVRLRNGMIEVYDFYIY